MSPAELEVARAQGSALGHVHTVMRRGAGEMTDTLGIVLDLRTELDVEVAELEQAFQQPPLAQRATRSALPPVSFPWWMRAVDHAHGCRRTFVAPLTDAGAMALAAAIAGLPAGVAALIG